MADPNSGCWLWVSSLWGNYGHFWYNRKFVAAHKMSKLIYSGTPLVASNKKMHWDHTCRTPSCVNPAHLQLVTARENTRRGTNFIATHINKVLCKRGHPLTTILKSNARDAGKRECKICKREVRREKRRRRRRAGVPHAKVDLRDQG